MILPLGCEKSNIQDICVKSDYRKCKDKEIKTIRRKKERKREEEDPMVLILV